MTAKSRKAQIAGLSEFTRTRKEASRSRLLEAARRVFNRSGYLAPSVDDIAQEAGVSRQTFYRHFDGKLAIAMEYFDRQNEFALPLWTRIAHENFTDPMVSRRGSLRCSIISKGTATRCAPSWRWAWWSRNFCGA